MAWLLYVYNFNGEAVPVRELESRYTSGPLEIEIRCANLEARLESP